MRQSEGGKVKSGSVSASWNKWYFNAAMLCIKMVRKMQITLSLSSNVIKKRMAGDTVFNPHNVSPVISTEKVPLIC